MEPNDELLSAYLDDELSSTERTLVEQRLETDDAYRRRYEDYRALREAVQKLPRQRLRNDFAKQVMDLIATRQANPEQATTELAPGVSKPTPTRLVRRIVPWVVASLAAGVVFVLLTPVLRDAENDMASRPTGSVDEPAAPAEGTSMDKSGSGLPSAAPASSVDAKDAAVDEENVADNAYSVDLFYDREAQPTPKSGVVLEKRAEGQLGQEAAKTRGVEESVEFDTFAEIRDETRRNLGSEEYDYVVAATSVNDVQLRAALARQEIVAAGAPLNLGRSRQSRASNKSPSLSLPDRRFSPVAEDATTTRSPAAAAQEAATTTANGFAGGAGKGVAGKGGERFRRRADSLAGTVEQDTATRYVLVEASQQCIRAVLQDLSQAGPRIELSPKNPSRSTWAMPAAGAGEFWYQLADEGELEREGFGARKPAASHREQAPDAATVERRAAKSVPRLAERQGVFQENGTDRDSDLDDGETLELGQQVRQQNKARFAAPSDQPAQQDLAAEVLKRKLGRVAGEGEDRVRVLFVVRTSPSNATTPADSSPAQQPARRQ